MVDPFGQAGLSPRIAPADALLADSDLAESIDFSPLNEIFADFLDVVGLPMAIVDRRGRVLASSKWQRICVAFHRVHETTRERCRESDTVLAESLADGKDYALYRCRNGLTDFATPIIVEGVHLANLFIGQFLLAPPDPDEFRLRQLECGFDQDAYFQALAEVPIVREDKLPAIIKLVGGLARQIARQSLAELRVAESERRFRAAQEASLDAFIIFQPIRDERGATVDLRVLYANHNAARYCRSTSEAMRGALIGDILPGTREPGGIIESHARVADSGQPLDCVIEYGADGIHGAFHNLVVSFDGLIATTFRDVTAAHEAKRALELAKLAAEKANDGKSRFLAAASHDLRQPLQALTLYLQVLGRRLGPADAPIMGQIDLCLVSLSELLNDLLDLSKLDAGVVEPKISRCSLTRILDALAATHAGAARQKGLRFRVVASDRTLATDPALFERVVGNLISNAVRYTQTGGVAIGCRRRGGVVWLEVADTGIGIPEDQRDAIFEEFSQLGNPERAREKGSGLGLAIVRKTTELLGLDIKVRSRLGHGSTFAVRLPLASPPAHAAPRHPAEPEPTRSQALRIALIEDNFSAREALTLALEDAGHQVIAAPSCRESLRRLGGEGPDLAVADYRLAEGQTGLEAVATIRAAFGAHLPAVILTGETAPDIVREIAREDLKVLHKPVRFDALIRCLEEVWTTRVVGGEAGAGPTASR